MERESLWLGALRGPMKLLMIALIAALALIGAWMIFGVLFLGSSTTMASMLRPGDDTTMRVFLWLLLAASVVTSVYLSDTRGVIEVEPTGALDILSLVCARAAMVGVFVLVCVMFYEVVARYVFSSPTLWANELSLWMAGFIFLLAGQYSMQQRSHIRIYIIYDMMPRWGQKLSDVVSVLLIWVFFAALVWGGYNEVAAKLGRMETFGTAWDPPIPSTVKAGILIIIGLVSVQALSNLIADWNKAPEHHSPMDDVDQTEIEHIKKALEGGDHG